MNFLIILYCLETVFPMIKTFLSNILVYSLILFITLPVIEIVLSVVDPEQIMVNVEDTEIVYKFYPNKEGIAFGPEYKVKVRTNQLSNRDCEENSKKVQVTNSKILILGDSFSEGWGVECKETFHYPLSTNHEVINAGIHGGSLPYYIIKLKSIMKEESPDEILVQFFDNDLDDAEKISKFFLWDEGRVKKANPLGIFGMPANRISLFFRELSLIRLIRKIVTASKGQREPIKYYKSSKIPDQKILNHKEAIAKFGALKPITDFEKEYNGQFEFYKYKNLNSLYENEIWKVRFQNFQIQLSQLVEIARNKNPNINIKILYIPSKEALYGFSNYSKFTEQNPFLQMLKEITNREKLKLIDASIPLSNRAEDYYFPGDAHLNSDGHKVVSEYLLRNM
jgi:hypothetical protein